MKLRIFIAVSLVLIVAIIPLHASAAGTSHMWYLTAEEYTGTIPDDGTQHACDNIISKTQLNGSVEAELIGSIGPDDRTAWWYSDSAAQQDVVFGEGIAGVWNIDVYLLNMFCKGVLHADIYSISPSGDMTLLASGATPITSTTLKKISIMCLDNCATQQIIPKDHRIGLRLEFVSSCCFFNGVILLYNSQCIPSFLATPTSDPGFPIPELSTILLFGGGLIGLAGYISVSRLRKRRI